MNLESFSSKEDPGLKSLDAAQFDILKKLGRNPADVLPKGVEFTEDHSFRTYHGLGKGGHEGLSEMVAGFFERENIKLSFEDDAEVDVTFTMGVDGTGFDERKMTPERVNEFIETAELLDDLYPLFDEEYQAWFDDVAVPFRELIDMGAYDQDKWADYKAKYPDIFDKNNPRSVLNFVLVGMRFANQDVVKGIRDQLAVAEDLAGDEGVDYSKSNIRFVVELDERKHRDEARYSGFKFLKRLGKAEAVDEDEEIMRLEPIGPEDHEKERPAGSDEDDAGWSDWTEVPRN